MDVSRVNSPGYQAPAAAPEAAAPAQPAVATQAAVPVPPMPEVAFERTSRDERSMADSLERAVNAINATIASYSRHLSVSLHQSTGRRMVTVYNSETNEPIREIPPRAVLDAHANVLELAGLLVDTRG